MKPVVWIVLFTILLMFSGIAIAEGTETQQYTDRWGIEYTIEFDRMDETILVTVNNPTGEESPSSFRVVMDDGYSVYERFELRPKESRSFSYDFTQAVDVTRYNHSVRFNAGPDPLWFNYTKSIDPSTTKEYPVPEITGVSVETTQYRGEERSIINVTGHNPSSRFWTLTIRAHTFETNGHYGIIQFSPHNSSYEQIILNEKPGELVGGEVRMYYGNFSEADGAVDQVEIKGKSTGEVSWSHEEYEPVVPPWEDEDDYYVYENKSVHREKIGAPETIEESPVAWIVGAVLLVFGLSRIRKYRR